MTGRMDGKDRHQFFYIVIMSSSEKCAGKPNSKLEVKIRGERYTLVRIKFRVVVGEKNQLGPLFLVLCSFFISTLYFLPSFDKTGAQ
jgi:hypothetical protein